MGKCDTNKVIKHHLKPYRKTVLGSNNLAIFLRPSLTDFISSSKVTSQLQHDGNENLDGVSAINLFEMLKDINKLMVKGTKLYESLKELRLCGWIMPYTLILAGPQEDMKIVKHAWVKRHLKSPQGYFIRDIGMVQDFVVELIPQSPFMSLTTALFDAVADLNHQNIFPTKHNLYEYLKKHYPEIKTPETRVIHDCLGRLIKGRRLYHNGRGYFVLHNENVLNEVIATKVLEKEAHANAEALLSVKGFALSSSMTTSSSPGQTDLEVNGDTSAAQQTTPDVTSIDSGAGTPHNMKKFFKRNFNKSEKKIENKVLKPKVFSCGIGGTMTDSVTILANKPISPNESETFKTNGSALSHNKHNLCADKNKTILNEHFSSDSETVCEHSFSDVTVTGSEKAKAKRSRSFGGKDSKKCHKEVSFALFGSPTHGLEGDSDDDDNNDDEGRKNNNYFKKRSYSFGAGYSKRLHKRPVCTGKNKLKKESERKGHMNSNENSTNAIDLDDYSTYVDVENSFVDDSLPLHLKLHDHLVHQPDMRPVQSYPHEQLFNYTDLGSALSLQVKTVPYSVCDLASPPKSVSLAAELCEAYDVKESCAQNDQVTEIEQLDRSLLSPRSRRKFGGTPYESHYVEDLLDDVKTRDENMNVAETKNVSKQFELEHKNDGKKEKSKLKNNVKLRTRSTKSAEQRKKDQKERNSLLFEEKRASLKVMGIV